MVTRYQKPTPVNPAPIENMATSKRPLGITQWGAVTGTRAGVPDRKDLTMITLN